MLRIPLIAALTLLPLSLWAESMDTQRARFQQALDNVGKEQQIADPTSLRDYPLYPYLEAARLQQRLSRLETEGAMDGELAAWLQQHGDAPWTRRLRAAWLKQLAERQDWSRFDAHYVEASADTALRCWKLQSGIAAGRGSALEADALAIWRTGSELPASCAPVFEWLKARGKLDINELAVRIRLALENQKVAVANMLIRQLPSEQRDGFQRWADVLSNPADTLESAIRQGVDPQGVIDGFSKIARRGSAGANAMIDRIEAACGRPCTLPSPGGIGEMRREVALNMSWSRLPGTVDAFRRVPVSALDERGHEWRVRAALWAGQWQLAHDWILEMPEAMFEDGRWRYWRGRSAEKIGREAQARADYEQLMSENGYYSVLAAERLGKAYTPHPQQLPGDPAFRAQIAASPGMARMREAWLIEQKSWAISEWKALIEARSPPQLIDIARVISGWGWHLMAVATSTQAQVFNDFELLYPRPYARELEQAAREQGLPANWVWGVLRQESLFDKRARSSANARGLLQLLPATARNVARRNGWPRPSLEDLYQPETNLRLGAAYLREQRENFGGRFVLVLGAYNAGPGAVKRWLPSAPLETDVWVENVPYNETRAYIQRIIWHSTVFGWQASGKPQRISRWLTPISADLSPLPGT